VEEVEHKALMLDKVVAQVAEQVIVELPVQVLLVKVMLEGLVKPHQLLLAAAAVVLQPVEQMVELE
jgi:hypothetical protein